MRLNPTLCQLLVVLSLVACHKAEKPNAESAATPIHPKVFQMVLCWDSDMISPVLTEINLDAVYRNNDQFDFKRLEIVTESEGDSVYYRDQSERGYLSYRVLEEINGVTRIKFYENGGGSGTSSETITYETKKRTVRIDGEKVEISVLSVLAIGD